MDCGLAISVSKLRTQSADCKEISRHSMCEVIVRIWRELAAAFADLAHAAVSNMPQLMDYHCYIVGEF